MVNSSIFLMLRDFEILKSLSEKELEKMTKSASLVRFQKNSLIYQSGDDKEFIYLVQKGSIKLGINVSCGKILLKDVIFENSLFGENIFVDNSRRKEFAKALTESSVIKISSSVFKNLVIENGVFANDVMGIVLRRLQLLEERMHAFIFKKAKSRIMGFLRKTGKLQGIKIGLQEILINHGMSHKEIAYLTDTSRQTVARVLGELKRENLIHFSARKPNKILIRNIVELR